MIATTQSNDGKSVSIEIGGRRVTFDNHPGDIAATNPAAMAVWQGWLDAGKPQGTTTFKLMAVRA